MFNINGLEGNYYYVNNPIYVEFFVEEDSFIQLYIEGEKMAEIKALAEELTYLDISQYVKSFLGIPDLDQTSAGLEKLDLVFLQSIQQVGLNVPLMRRFMSKFFLRGGFYNGINNQASNGDILKETDKIPVWEGYQAFFNTIDGNAIATSFLVPENYKEEMRVRTCNPIYLAFLNTKGAFSTYLFDSYTLEFKTGSSENNRLNPQPNAGILDFDSIGGEAESRLTVKARVDKRHFNLMRALAYSPIVYVYRLNDIVDDYPNIRNIAWTKIKNNGNTFNFDSGDRVKDFTFNFDTNFTEQTSFKW